MKTSEMLFVILTLFSGFASALVDMNNACYSNTWVDLEIPSSGFNLRVMRAYKSRSIYNGMYGFGWCSELETRLTTTPEGYVKINECGDGQEIIFAPSEISRKDVDSAITRIIEKMKSDKKNSNLSADYYAQLKAKLLKDQNLRESYAAQNAVIIPVKEGIKFFANGREVENIVLQKKIYTRTLEDGSLQRYDLSGHLIGMFNKNGEFLKLTYEKDQITSVEDNNFHKLNFKYFANGKVQKVTGPGLAAEYKYSEADDLIWVKPATAKNDNDVLTYEYNEYHNLTKVLWPDKTFISIKYDNAKDWVIAFTDRDKCTETYKYETSAANPDLNYWSTTTKTCGKDVVATNRYEFWHKQLATGETVLSRVQTNLNGNIKDVTYDDVLGKPLIIKVNNDLAEYQYYANGLLKSKNTAYKNLEFSYNTELQKVSKVVIKQFDDKKKVVSTNSSSFKYDKKGNLIFAENSDGQKIQLIYDFNGRIIKIIDGKKITINLKYNEQFGKPSEVQRADLGSVKIAYNSKGEIANVESSKGPAVAEKIAGSYSKLLSILAPASQNIY